MANLKELQALSIPSVEDGESHSSITSLIARNWKTLRLLDLGVEADLVDYNKATPKQMYLDNLEDQTARHLREQIERAFEGTKRSILLPNIDKLRLRGLDLNALMIDSRHQLFDYQSLIQLTLGSCCELEIAMPRLTSIAIHHLRSFHIRQESISDDFIPTLETFLCELPPLTSLWVQLDGDYNGLDVKRIMEIHGESLQNLIMDLMQKGEPIDSESETESYQQYSMDIIEKCPNLVELGIGVDWDNLALGYKEEAKTV